MDSSGHELFLFSYSSLEERATVVSFKARTCEHLRTQILNYVSDLCSRKGQKSFNLIKLERVVDYTSVSLDHFAQLLANTRRNYFPHGIGFDQNMETVVSRDEINGWCLLYSSDTKSCFFRKDNFKNYFNKTGKTNVFRDSDDPSCIYLFNTIAGFSDPEGVSKIVRANSYNCLREDFVSPNLSTIQQVVHRATEYLARQIDASGKYTYGRWPCFDKHIPSYNMLRHFSSTYALIEGWELSGKDVHLNNAARAIDWGIAHGFYQQKVNGRKTCFLKEGNDELKLGGSAQAIIAISKYMLASQDRQYVKFLPSMLRGLLYFQAEGGIPNHVLHCSSLEVKDKFRTIYYDGEALYALLMAFKVLRADCLLVCAKNLAQSFIDRDYFQYRDHWQAYAFRDLYLITGHADYLNFLVKNISGYTGFVKDRITTYPTLLELCVSSFQAFDEVRRSGCLPKSFNSEGFISAMISRAEYLLNGFFAPELAMNFKNPDSIVDSFFIRHHGFRTRIDDNEHYISGLAGYYNLIRKYLQAFDQSLFRNRPFTLNDLRIVKLSFNHKSLVAQFRPTSTHVRSSTTVAIKITPFKQLPFQMYQYLRHHPVSFESQYQFLIPSIHALEQHGKTTYVESDWLELKQRREARLHHYDHSRLLVEAIADFEHFFSQGLTFTGAKTSYHNRQISLSRELLQQLFADDDQAIDISNIFNSIHYLFAKVVHFAVTHVNPDLICICHNDMASSNVHRFGNGSDLLHDKLVIIDLDEALTGIWGQDLRFLIRYNLNEKQLKSKHLAACEQYVSRLRQHGRSLSVEHVFYASVFEYAYKNFNIHRQKPQRQKLKALIESINAVRLLLE
ncbi:hypothetical protein [Synechococcus sp. KORDI-52]|uniref:hypothetical protein n=1 Tax=Synechococcus sp. KORDI-52 TaxID=585425 RepID=UPI0012ECA1C7|nr:hypothetical protein [Synechococcus sp. KORDI-52]